MFETDETVSIGLAAVFETTNRQWDATTAKGDQWLTPTGRVMEMLSEQQCNGWLAGHLPGYLLTGRHGLVDCCEAFVHIVDSMFNQHAKWLKVSAKLPWRPKIASLNYLLASHVWRQDHNGFTHQDPGLIDPVVNKKAEVVRVYLPPDATCLLSVMDHCLRWRIAPPASQGGGHHHHALRHDRAQRPGPVPPGDGRHRSPAADQRSRRRVEG